MRLGAGNHHIDIFVNMLRQTSSSSAVVGPSSVGMRVVGTWVGPTGVGARVGEGVCLLRCCWCRRWNLSRLPSLAAAMQRQRAAQHLILMMAASRETSHFACMWQLGCAFRAVINYFA